MKYYRIYNRTGDLVAIGDAAECAEVVGIGERWFREAAEKGRTFASGRYRVEIVTKEKNKAADDSKFTRAAIQAWDDFVTPIREKYGIPVWQEKQEEQE
jgi:hypothetical protein